VKKTASVSQASHADKEPRSSVDGSHFAEQIDVVDLPAIKE
jgi:hypothetical protein